MCDQKLSMSHCKYTPQRSHSSKPTQSHSFYILRDGLCNGTPLFSQICVNFMSQSVNHTISQKLPIAFIVEQTKKPRGIKKTPNYSSSCTHAPNMAAKLCRPNIFPVRAVNPEGGMTFKIGALLKLALGQQKKKL